MDFWTELDTYYGSRDPYKILSIERGCSSEEVKLAYRKMALKEHPDRSEHPAKEANVRFQIISKLCALMMDEEVRKEYEETGAFNDENSCLDKNTDWSNYWNLIYPKININQIKKFEKKYRYSTLELDDLKTAYLKHNGDMIKILEDVLCSSIDDYDRFVQLIKEEIELKNLKPLPKFLKTKSKKVQKLKIKFSKEAKEAEKLAQDLNVVGEGNLIAAIKANSQKNANRLDNLIDSLSQKYVKPKHKPKSVRDNN